MHPDKYCFAAWMVAALVLCGCGSTEPASVPVQQVGASPEETTKAFLEAVRTGDDKTAASLLTPIARQKTTEQEMVVAPPGSETASYAVHDVQYADEGAHVPTDWTDVDEGGHMHTDRIVWVLRKESEGWRIAGMATKLFADRPPIVLNFEDPQEMLRQQQIAEQELARREGSQPAKEARQPAEQPKSVR